MFAPRNSSPIQMYNPEEIAAYQVCSLKQQYNDHQKKQQENKKKCNNNLVDC